MKIEKAELNLIELPLVYPFETSTGIIKTKRCIIVSAYSDGITGWGECSAEAAPWYSSETTGTAWHILEEFIFPRFVGRDLPSINDVLSLIKPIRGNQMAKAAIENACWDLFAKAASVSLSDKFGGTKSRIAAGVSLGIENSINKLLFKIEKYLEEGYTRIKVKIKPGWDLDVVKEIRKQWPAIMLQVDANSSYSIQQADIFRELDKYNLLLIEQPFHPEDFLDHARLQKIIKTPVCLDESIHSFNDVELALELKSCKIFNIKQGRVGGFAEAIKIHNFCLGKGIPLWCGGMLETNIGRAGNAAIASLPGFVLPGDISASKRYFKEDIAIPDFILNPDSTINVPSEPGIGLNIIPSNIEKATLRHTSFR